jgi:hypothetical protein
MATNPTDIFKPVRLAAKLLCSSCQSAKFMRWDGDGLGGLDKPHGMNKDKETGTFYVLRCDYFKLTVFEPASLRSCDAWKEKGDADA